jgi:uncharacterized iron-regulated membrane protein
VPWWSWILIWVALVACTLVVLLLGGIYLFRKGMAVLRSASADLERVTARPAAVGTTDDAGPAALVRVPGSAVFANPERLREEYEQGREQRRLARRDRRVARRRERGQMQSLRDLGLN